MANRALQYLAAAGIQQHAPGAVIENVCLHEWGMHAPHTEPPFPRSVRTGTSRFWLDVAGLGDCLRRGVVDAVIMDGYSFNLANFPPRAVARKLIGPTVGSAAAPGFGPRELVCSVRAAEVLRAIHPDYIVLPPRYYQILTARSGLDLVFYGQIEDNPYIDSLRAALPQARFVAGSSPEYDFEMLRRSVNIAPSVSTFAWLAAWLSEAERVYLPVCGMLSPVQLSGQMFLPLDEPSFSYTLFPYTQAVNLYAEPVKFMHVQDVLGDCARPVDAQTLRRMCERAEGLFGRQPLLSGFDEEYYLSQYPDVAAVLAQGHMRSALHHYLNAGFYEGRKPLAIHTTFYASVYPDAAMEIAEGRYADPLHHFQAVGYAKGYRPLP